MALHFPEPWYLALLLLLPAFWLAASRLRAISPARRWAIIGLRTLLVSLLVFALSRVEWRNRSEELTVYFLLDESDSIPTTVREGALNAIREMSGKMTQRDWAGLIAFGDQPSLDTAAVRRFEMKGAPASVVAGHRTDISAAMRLALAAFPNDTMKRVVLLTDGNENEGSALEVARLARNSNVPVDVVPLRYEQQNDVQIDKLVVPQQTARDAPFDLKAFITAQKAGKGRLRVFEDSKPIVDEEVEVTAGKNPPLVLSRRLKEGGFHTYKATFEAAGDSRPQNNQATGFTYLKAEPRVLYVEGDQTSQNYLAAALRAENIACDPISPRDFPLTIDGIQNYDSVILSNVAASEFSGDQMRMIERSVHDLGIGLVMIGGENSFGAGGYQDTPVEQALPVSMDVKQKKVLPNGALAIILHTCEIPEGNSWAREISIAALNVLSAQDYFGLIYYGPGMGSGAGGFGGYGEFWAWEPGLKMAGNKREMRALIRGVQPSDMPTFDPTINMAYRELQRVNTTVKHIVIISDGDPAPPSPQLASQIADAGITISTVIIAPHAGDSVDNMKELAYIGRGNFYYPKTSSELPRIFTKEATVVRKSLISEKTFTPAFGQSSEVMAGFVALPALQGYVVTSMKDLATNALMSSEDDPLLAHWRYGLGKSAAFTSDAKNKWASQWVNWNEFSKFWAQVVRFSLRETSSQNFQVNTEIRGGRGHISLDALTMDGDFRNFLDFQTTVVGPDFKPQTVTVRQTAPGRYEGDFDAAEVGTYMVSMATGDKDARELVTSGAALSYSPEYEATRSNDDFLEKIASSSGGRMAGPDYSAFSHDLPAMQRPKPLWHALLFAAVLLLPVDIFVRRVYLDWGEMKAAVAKWLPGAKSADAGEAAKSIASLRQVKRRTRDEEDQEKAARQARDEFRVRVEQQAKAPDGSPDIFADPTAKPAAPVRHRVKDTVVASEGGADPSAQPGMAGLLEAKKRARKKME